MDGIIPASVSGTSKGRLPFVRAAPGRKQEKREREKERKSELCDVSIDPGKIASLAKAKWQSH